MIHIHNDAVVVEDDIHNDGLEVDDVNNDQVVADDCDEEVVVNVVEVHDDVYAHDDAVVEWRWMMMMKFCNEILK